ncbi:hypothetical protein AJ78_08294 [Emergomyces pasteurianus Ep9510]|uniref:Uncharacterized protein n=1 Tax=Emergomyces pasteurianus Ep9510 TaxID=1447872 RepID=A0A1J9P4I8_9EURO|nr:hypothetical protein AJ78_08294 [Emergomyces pasteurianus Ep9510]
MIQAQNVIKLIVNEKKLSREKRLREPMYVDDLAKYLRVLLIMNEMKHHKQSARCLDSASVSESKAHTDLELSLQCILSMRRADRSLYQDLSRHEEHIIYDSTLMLSLHVFLLKILFYIQTFKSSSIRRLKNLYSLSVLNELNQQKLLLQNNLTNLFIFYFTVCKEDDV